ncbi:MAG: hypothetical protein J6M30_08555 [Bacteroidales bacterium]|nr:hypothetical protein [Bacteroidales bacterium]
MGLKLVERLIFKLLCQFLTEWGEVKGAVLDGYFHQIQMAVKFLVVLNGKEFIPIARGNLIQELGEIADVALLVGLEVGCDEDNALVRQSVASFTSLPEADVKANAILTDRHIEANLMSLKCDVVHTDAVVLIEIHGDVKY